MKADSDALAAIKGMSDYGPSNVQFTLDKLTASSGALGNANEEFAKAEATFKARRDDLVKAQWAFHNLMLGAKQQVVAQYGDDSDQAQSVGLKKKSERARPAARSTGAAATA
jgi:hypothetical protein